MSGNPEIPGLCFIINTFFYGSDQKLLPMFLCQRFVGLGLNRPPKSSSMRGFKATDWQTI